MHYQILKTRYFVVDQQKIERRELFPQLFESLGFARCCLDHLETYHDRGNVPNFYPLEEGELSAPTYEIVPICECPYYA